jgi:asparaginyl-tRNA synthetase
MKASVVVTIGSLVNRVGEQVSIRGHVSKIQSFPKHQFIEVRDGVGDLNKIQVVVSPPVDVKFEQYVELSGAVRSLPPGKRSYNGIEMHMTEGTFVVIGSSDNNFTNICPPNAGPVVRLEQRHLYLRDREFALITRIRSIFIKTLRNYFDSIKSTEIVPPCFVANQSEGGATLFNVKYPPTHDEEPIDAYLTQSSQFYLEMAVPAIGDCCYCVYPSFRAERSHTRRHLTEFLHAECEWKDVFTFDQHLDKLRHLVTEVVRRFRDSARVELEQLGVYEHVVQMAEMPIVELTHAEAIVECRKRGIYKDEATKTQFGPRDDIPEMQERALIDQIGKIVLLTKFPAEFKSFYMARDATDHSLALGCDVEVPGVGEIIGSGVRVYDEKELLEYLHSNNLKESEYSEYVDLRRYGNARTSGMGLGVDRMLTWLLKRDSIRDVVTFPRYPGRITP